MKVSASLLKTWMKCSLQARYKYIESLPDKSNAAAAFGSAVHIALELYNNVHDVDVAERAFLEMWDNPDEFDLAIDVWPPRTSFGAYRERGVDFIRKYHEENKWVKKEIIATEHRFCVPLGDHFVSGIIDVIEVPDKTTTLKIIDFKSGYRPNSQGLNHDVQFSTYLYAPTQKEFWCGSDEDRKKYTGFPNGEELWERFQSYETVGIWYDLRNTKEYHVGPRDQSDYDKLLMCIEQIARAIELEVFVPDISGDSCGLCSYRDICPLFSSRKELQSVEDS
jgi:RecB family exonuclease